MKSIAKPFCFFLSVYLLVCCSQDHNDGTAFTNTTKSLFKATEMYDLRMSATFNKLMKINGFNTFKHDNNGNVANFELCMTNNHIAIFNPHSKVLEIIDKATHSSKIVNVEEEFGLKISRQVAGFHFNDDNVLLIGDNKSKTISVINTESIKLINTIQLPFNFLNFNYRDFDNSLLVYSPMIKFDEQYNQQLEGVFSVKLSKNYEIIDYDAIQPCGIDFDYQNPISKNLFKNSINGVMFYSTSQSSLFELTFDGECQKILDISDVVDQNDIADETIVATDVFRTKDTYLIKFKNNGLAEYFIYELALDQLFYTKETIMVNNFDKDFSFTFPPIVASSENELLAVFTPNYFKDVLEQIEINNEIQNDEILLNYKNLLVEAASFNRPVYFTLELNNSLLRSIYNEITTSKIQN
jgi:hypothetical protein